MGILENSFKEIQEIYNKSTSETSFLDTKKIWQIRLKCCDFLLDKDVHIFLETFSRETCPLCKAYWHSKECKKCPVNIHTGRIRCGRSPCSIYRDGTERTVEGLRQCILESIRILDEING